MNMRISGLATGIDTEQMIKDLMKAQRVKVDRLEQDKQLLTWRQEIYNDLNKEFANFILDTKKEFGLSRTTSTGLYVNNSVSGLDWVKKATVSNTDFANVSARADAIEGTYKVKVHNLATNFNVASDKSLGPLKSLKEQFN
ncbi:MAG: flagellar cap protein FliD N-terminal domain-containing protein, partial [Peptococcales bacterium]